VDQACGAYRVDGSQQPIWFSIKPFHAFDVTAAFTYTGQEGDRPLPARLQVQYRDECQRSLPGREHQLFAGCSNSKIYKSPCVQAPATKHTCNSIHSCSRSASKASQPHRNFVLSAGIKFSGGTSVEKIR
jgi:hypothetical protein